MNEYYFYLLIIILFLLLIIIRLYGRMNFYKAQVEVAQDLYENVIIKQLNKEIKLLTNLLIKKKSKNKNKSSAVSSVELTVSEEDQNHGYRV